MSLADLIERLQGNLPLVGIIAAAVYYFWPQIKTAFAGGISGSGSKPPDEFLDTVDSARDLIKYLETAKDEEGATAARKAAARLFEPEAKAK
jgi:hypothetical protein